MDDRLSEAREFRYSQPEEAQDQLRRIAERALRAGGVEDFTTEEVEALALSLIAERLGDRGARLEEITGEEYRRIRREEFERLAFYNPAGAAGVSADDLLEAVAVRLKQEYGHFLEP